MNGRPDESYKFGAGRFIMKQGLLETIGPELARYGSRPFIVGGPTAMSVVKERMTAGLAAAGIEGVFSVHPGHVNHTDAQTWAQEARSAGCDMVVAVGGGRGMDFGKLVAGYLDSNAVCLPTSLSTCAAYAPFSLVYTPEGQTLPGNFCYDFENLAILVDLDVMATQPPRYVISGALDAMAKFIEIRNGSPAFQESGAPLSLCAGSRLATFTYERLTATIDQVLANLAQHKVTPALEDMVFLNILLPGIISGLSRGVGQSAIAHELYYQARLLFTKDVLGALHGEIVGLGLLPQLYYNGEADQVEPFRALLKRLGAPTCLTGIGFQLTEENYNALYEAIAASNFVGKDEASRRRFAEALATIKA